MLPCYQHVQVVARQIVPAVFNIHYSGSLPTGGTTGLTGIRQVGTTNNVYITGSYVVNGLSNGTLYVGGVSGGGTYYVYNYLELTH